MTDTQSLIEKLKAGSGPDARLCADVYSAVVPSAKPSPGLPGCVEICGDPTHMVNVSGLTTSLDACIGLMREVLPGWNRACVQWNHDVHSVVLCRTEMPFSSSGFGHGCHVEETYATLIAILQAVGEAG